MILTDHEAPNVTCPASQTVHTIPSQAFATVFYTDPQVSDNSGENVCAWCDIESGSQFWIGETDVICKAMDLSGNQAICSFTVKVEGNEPLL